VPPPVLSTGFSVLIHLMWAQMKPLFLTLDERSRKTRSIHAPTWDEHVISGSDCGFSSQANSEPEVHPTVVWAKFEAMAEGARLATRQLWG